MTSIYCAWFRVILIYLVKNLIALEKKKVGSLCKLNENVAFLLM